MTLATLAGLLFTFPTSAQDNTATNPNEAAQAASDNSTEKAEIASLKEEIQALEQKVNALERNQESQQQSTQIQKLNQKSAT